MPYNEKSKKNLAQYRIRVPSDWTKTRILTARSAIVACSACRNHVSRGLDDVADQIEGARSIIGSFDRPAAGLAFAPGLMPTIPATLPAKIELLTGTGQKIAGWMGTATILIEMAQGLLASAVVKIHRSLATAVRKKTKSCCEENVKKRLLEHGTRYTDDPHRTSRRRKRKKEK